jgi:hypothetical protein
MKTPVDVQIRVELAVLSREMSAVEATRWLGVSDMSVSKWMQQFLGAGRQRLEEQPSAPSVCRRLTWTATARQPARLRLPSTVEQWRCAAGGLVVAVQLVQLAG